MAPLSMLVFLVYIIRVSGKSVILNGTAQLTVSGSCAGGEVQLVRVGRTDHVHRTLAGLVGGVWEPAEDYKDRVHHVSTSTVNLTGVNFNDDAFYEFTCKNELINTIDVTVVFPYDVRVSEGETARIPCYSSTEGIQGVRWERDGEPVLVQNCSSGQPEGRLSVSPDWVQTGDLSLTVKDAQLQDGGSYVCYTVDGNGEKTRGRNPAAVTVTVQESRPAPTGAPQQPTQTAAEEQIGTGFIVSIAFNVLLLVASVIFCVLWLVSVYKARRAAGVGPPAGTEMEPLGGDPDQVPNGGAHRAEPRHPETRSTC